MLVNGVRDGLARCDSDCHFGVSLACLRGCSELEKTSEEWMLPRHVSRPNIWFKRGNMESENTYRMMRGMRPLYSALLPSCLKSARATATVCERLEWPGGVGLR